jgi:hypothetical protein
MNNSAIFNLSNTTVRAQPAVDPLRSFINLYINTIGYLYIIPAINVAGVFLNIVCIILLCSKSLKGDIYKYLLLKTVCELLIVILGAMLPYGNCVNCLSFQTLGAQIYRAYGVNILNSILFAVSMLTELGISYDRLVIFKKYASCLPKIPVKYAFVGIFSISIGIFVPFIFSNSIVEIEQQTNRWRVMMTAFGRSIVFNIYSIIISLFASILLMILFCFINLQLLIQYKRYQYKRLAMLGKSSVNLRTTNNNSIYSIDRVKTFTNNSVFSMKEELNNKSGKSTEKEGTNSKLTYSILLCCFVYSINKICIGLAALLILLDVLLRTPSSPSTIIVAFFLRLISYMIFSANLFILILFNTRFRHHTNTYYRRLISVVGF